MGVLFRFACISFLAVASTGCGGFELKEGKLDFLKGEKVLNVAYDYSAMSVGKFKSEAEYTGPKVEELNKEEPGRGDIWLVNWREDRASRFQPKFEELMNVYLADKGVKVSSDGSARYTLILRTTHTEPGWNAVVMKQPAMINVEVLLVETNARDRVLARLTEEDIPGQTAWAWSDLDVGTRLQESYAKCGKELGKYLAEHF